MAAAIVVMLTRLAWHRTGSEVGYAAFLLMVGGLALAGIALTANLAVSAHPVVRYIHLALLVPIGCFAAFMVR
jgi:hypothetical protein